LFATIETGKKERATPIFSKGQESLDGGLSVVKGKKGGIRTVNHLRGGKKEVSGREEGGK